MSAKSPIPAWRDNEALTDTPGAWCVTGLPTTEWDTLITTITSLHDHQREAELEANGRMAAGFAGS